MQGRVAAEQIAAAVARFALADDSVDAIVLVRGGGSTSDLSTFDDERVAVRDRDLSRAGDRGHRA